MTDFLKIKQTSAKRLPFTVLIIHICDILSSHRQRSFLQTNLGRNNLKEVKQRLNKPGISLVLPFDDQSEPSALILILLLKSFIFDLSSVVLRHQLSNQLISR